MKYFGSDYWKYAQLNKFKEELMKYDINILLSLLCYKV